MTGGEILIASIRTGVGHIKKEQQHRTETKMRRSFIPNETVYCRFTGEAFVVIACNGCVADLRDGAGNITGRIVGELTR